MREGGVDFRTGAADFSKRRAEQYTIIELSPESSTDSEYT